MSIIATFQFHAGEDVYIDLVPSPDYIAAGGSIDITGWATSFIVRQVIGGPILFTKTNLSGITYIDPTNGKARVQIQRADSVSLPITTYIFEWERTDANFNTTLTEGTFTLLARKGT